MIMIIIIIIIIVIIITLLMCQKGSTELRGKAPLLIVDT